MAVGLLLFVRLFPRSGPVAQLGARVNGIHEVTGSSPGWPTNPRSRLDNRSVGYGWQANAEVAHRSGEAAKVGLQIPRTGSRTHTGAIVRVNFASRSEGAPEPVTAKVVSLSPS